MIEFILGFLFFTASNCLLDITVALTEWAKSSINF